MRGQRAQESISSTANVVYSMGIEGRGYRVFVYCIVEGVKITALVDSGADISLISRSTLDRIGKLHSCCSETIAVRGILPSHPFRTQGMINLDININDFQAPDIKFHVLGDEEMAHDIVLGADFLYRFYMAPSPAHQRLIYMPPKMSPRLIGTPVSLSVPLVLDRSIVLQPRSINFVSVGEPDITWREILFEPEVCLLEISVAFSRCIVQPEENKLTLEVVCMGSEPKTLKKGTVIGTCRKVEYAEVTEVSSNIQQVELPSNLFDFSQSNLSTVQRNLVMNMLNQYSTAISFANDDVGSTESIQHEIQLKDPNQKPVKIPPRRFRGKVQVDIARETDQLYKDGIIEPTDSPWSAPVVPVYKPNGDMRLCIDYRGLNKVTLKDAYPLPNMEDTLTNLHGIEYFSSLDLIRGYYQVPVAESSRPYTAFTTSGGHWQFCRMPFGLCNAPGTFQRLMNNILASFSMDRVMAYIDDVLVMGKSFEDHLQTLAEVLKCLNRHGLKIKPQKCKLFCSQVQFLGHLVSSEGLQPVPDNLKAIMEYPPPKTLKGVRRFMGMVNFYRRFIPLCSVLMKPISALTGQKKVIWTDECQKAFQALKDSLVNPPILAFPNFESDEPLCLYTDASQYGAGAHLTQKQEGIEKAIAYISSTFNAAEIKYSVLDKELAAIRWAVKRLKPFLWGRSFVIYTDHKPLTYLQGMRLLDGRLARTLEELGDYDFEMRYLPGKHNVIADALSRDTLSQPVSFGIEDSKVLEDMSETSVKGGADTLFRCFSQFLFEMEDEHEALRIKLVDHILEHPEMYNLNMTSRLRRQLKIMRQPGILPIFEVVQSFSNYLCAPVFIYEELFGFVKYEPRECEGQPEPCYLRSYDSVHFTLLNPNYPDMSFVECGNVPSQTSVSTSNPEPIILYEITQDQENSFDDSNISVDQSFSLLKTDSKTPDLQKENSTTSFEDETIRKPENNLTPTSNSQNSNPDAYFQLDVHKDELEGAISWRQQFNPDTVRDWQNENKTLARLKLIIQESPNSTSKIKYKTKAHKNLIPYQRYLKEIMIDNNGLLVKEITKNVQNIYPYLVPFEAACDITRLAHMNSAHVGKRKLFYLVQPYIFHPKLNSIVATVTRSCSHCQKMKPYTSTAKPPIKKIQTDRPFQLVHVDLLELPHSGQRYRYVINAVDQYTKWLATQPLKDKTSRSCADAMDKILASLPSLPDTIISDNGGEFKGGPFRELLCQYGVKQKFVTPYSPQSNGLVERVNRTLLGIISGLCSPSEWEEYLTRAVVIYNNTYHSELKSTPSECLTGLSSRLSFHSKGGAVWRKGSSKFVPYTEGSLVGYRIFRRQGVSKKTSPRFKGPYKVKKVNPNERTYVIFLLKEPDKEVRAHHNQLRPWLSSPDYLQRSSIFHPGLLTSTAEPETTLADTSEIIPGLSQLMPLPCAVPGVPLGSVKTRRRCHAAVNHSNAQQASTPIAKHEVLHAGLPSLPVSPILGSNNNLPMIQVPSNSGSINLNGQNLSYFMPNYKLSETNSNSSFVSFANLFNTSLPVNVLTPNTSFVGFGPSEKNDFSGFSLPVPVSNDNVFQSPVEADSSSNSFNEATRSDFSWQPPVACRELPGQPRQRLTRARRAGIFPNVSCTDALGMAWPPS